jgi:acyl carrier protein|tara:strand:- start:610 stop:837 length:228 start_codon:yes stop_codon:yes gene_type:complete
MKKKELKKLILRIINDEEVNDLKGYEWDSLAHLSILMELDKIYPDKITSINDIAEMNTYVKLEKVLISKKLLNND